jgi:flavin reductase (DIM6/NTAB) family NADH-FMN oxidoreductase RutF
MEREWERMFAKMTYGIYLLTASHREEINGMIASWVSQVSYDPALVMVAARANRYSHHLIEEAGSFALHVLARTQVDWIARFKGPDPKAKFSQIEWTRGSTGCPILADCIAYAECVLRGDYRPGDHTLFVGEVVDSRVFAEKDPLCTLDYDGIYLGRQ